MGLVTGRAELAPGMLQEKRDLVPMAIHELSGDAREVFFSLIYLKRRTE
jgi:hypothetical protein